MDTDVDRHNFQTLPAGTRLGWIQQGAGCPVEARDASGTDRAPSLFEAIGSTLCTRRQLTPVMMTTSPEIARADCLFYAVRG
jgi:hypothetical protein